MLYNPVFSPTIIPSHRQFSLFLASCNQSSHLSYAFANKPQYTKRVFSITTYLIGYAAQLTRKKALVTRKLFSDTGIRGIIRRNCELRFVREKWRPLRTPV